MGKRTRTVVFWAALAALPAIGVAAGAVRAGVMPGVPTTSPALGPARPAPAAPAAPAIPPTAGAVADGAPASIAPAVGDGVEVVPVAAESAAQSAAESAAVSAAVSAVAGVEVSGGPIVSDDAITAAWRTPAPTASQIVLVGDSLAQEITPFVQFMTPGTGFVPKFWGGTAPCDWRDVDLQADRSSVVVITFTGNTLTDCMSDGRGGHLIDEALIDRYRTDVGVLIDHARSAGARVVLVGQPLRAPSFDADLEVDGINEVYRQYAAAYPYVSFVDAGRAVETPDGRYTDRLPCTPRDTDCADDGTTVVRGDGVHFCPVKGKNPCPAWSSGAFRFATVIVSAAMNPRAFD